MPLDEAKAKELINRGLSVAAVAAQMGVSARRIYQVRGEMPREPLDTAKRVKIGEALAAGTSKRYIAEQFGVSRKTVDAIAKEIDIVPATKQAATKVSDADMAQILAQREAGHSTGTIARAMGLAQSTVRSVIRRHGSHLSPDDVVMQAIVAELKRRGMTGYGLSQLVDGTPTEARIYEWIRGESSPSTVSASALLRALNLQIVRAPGTK